MAINRDDVKQDPRMYRDSGVPPVKGSGEIGMQLVQEMGQITLDRIGEDGLKNIERNHDLLPKGKSIRELRGVQLGEDDSAVIIAAGPSIQRTDIANRVKDGNYKGAVICSDSSLLYCLRHGIIPDLVVTLDPHATRIVRWFGDAQLNQETLDKDDYFARQDLDPIYADEMKTNRLILDLLNEHGSKIKIAVATCASQRVVDRVLETGMEIYWWNPMYDDPDEPDSVSEKIFDMNGIPCLNAGGNVGAACWMIADEVLGKKHIAVTGMDFSYYDGTPYKNTQYYYEAIDLVGEENLDSIYMRLFNPHQNKWYYTDPAYRWYREIFIEMIGEGSAQTYNCTEGGILFGEGIPFITLEEYFKRLESLKVGTPSPRGGN